MMVLARAREIVFLESAMTLSTRRSASGPASPATLVTS